jgi:hypothetical protein
VENWGIHMVKDKGCGWPKWLLKQGKVIFGLWDDFLHLGHYLIKKDLSNLLVPAPMDREFVW